MSLQLFKVIDSISGPTMCFVPGDVIGLKPGDSLPAGLAGVCERLPDDTGVPVDVIRLDPAAIALASRPRVEAPAPKPLTEADVRKRLRLQDPNVWAAAKALGFPTASLRRYQPAPLPALGHLEVHLWQEPDIDGWIERLRTVAPVVLAGRR